MFVYDGIETYEGLVEFLDGCNSGVDYDLEGFESYIRGLMEMGKITGYQYGDLLVMLNRIE